jgi:hypothetical protein
VWDNYERTRIGEGYIAVIVALAFWLLRARFHFPRRPADSPCWDSVDPRDSNSGADRRRAWTTSPQDHTESQELGKAKKRMHYLSHTRYAI